jgi:hypothetical protein
LSERFSALVVYKSNFDVFDYVALSGVYFFIAEGHMKALGYIESATAPFLMTSSRGPGGVYGAGPTLRGVAGARSHAAPFDGGILKS